MAAISNIEQYSQGSNSCETVTEHFMGGSLQERTTEYRAANPIEHAFLNPFIYCMAPTTRLSIQTSQKHWPTERSQYTYKKGWALWLATPGYCRIYPRREIT